MRRTLASLVCLISLAVLPGCSEPPPGEPELTVFVAASASTAMRGIARDYAKETGMYLEVVPGSSAVLARQIEQGAPAHIFVSANRDWVDYLEQRSVIEPYGRIPLVHNRLAAIAPAMLNITPETTFAEIMGEDGHVALCDESAPCGKYARDILRERGLWSRVEPYVVSSGNALTTRWKVESGEARIGVVYATDAFGNDKVQVLPGTALAGHDPITYEAAIIGPWSVDDPEFAKVLAFMEWLNQDDTRESFARYGFDPILTTHNLGPQ